MARAHTVNAPRGGKATTRRALRAVGYVRRSTDRQEQSIPDQKRAIERHAAEHGLKLLRFYTDDAISGTSTVRRRAFLAMIADAQRPSCDFGVVIVYDIKRFGRVDNDEAGYWRHILRTHGVEVDYVSENFSGTGTDDLLRPVKQWQAREESKDLAKVAIRGLLSKATNGGNGSGGDGWWMGGTPPYGYDLRYESLSGEFLFVLRYMPDGSKRMLDGRRKLIRTLPRGESISVSRRDRCKLVLSAKDRVEIVRRIFAMYVQDNRGFKAIADALNRDGIPTPRDPSWSVRCSGRWSMTTVRAILVNPAYCGDLAWNRHTDARFFRICNGQAVERQGAYRRRLEPNRESDWIVVKDAHPAIVSRRVFEAAKTRLRDKRCSKLQRGINPRTQAPAGDRPEGGWTGPRAKFLLSGLGVCSRCQSRYEGYTRYGNRNHNGSRPKTYHYACGGYIRHGRSVCTLGVIPRGRVEEAVIAALVSYYDRYKGTDARDRIAEAVGAQLGTDRTELARRRKSLQGRLSRLDGTTRNLLDNITAANRDLVDRRLAELDEKRKHLEAELESLEHNALTEAEVAETVRQTARFAASLGSTLRQGPLAERQAAVRRCVERIAVDADDRRLRIDLHVLPGGLDGPAPGSTETVTVTF